MGLILPRNHNPSYSEGFARSASESAAPGLWKGCVGLWAPSLGPTGLTLRDQSGFQNDGTLTNMDAATDWVIGGNPRLPGYVLDYLYEDAQTIEINQPLSFSATDHYTAIWWMRTTGASSGNNNGIYRSGLDSDGAYGWWVNRAGGELWGRHNSSDILSFSSGIPVTDGLWHQIVITWDGVDVRVYADGTEFTKVSLGTGTAWSVYRFGKQEGAEYYTGQIGPMLFSNRTIGPSEIQQLYDRPLDMLRPRPRVFPAAVAAPPAGFARPKVHGSLAHGRTGLAG